MSYKNDHTNEVISDSDYNSLPFHRKKDFKQVSSTPTHKVEDDGLDIFTTAIAVSNILDSFTPDTSSSDTSSSSGTDFGGGASGDF